jgi:protein-S-isoprenylcysteine O-methyltransferase Ste14
MMSTPWLITAPAMDGNRAADSRIVAARLALGKMWSAAPMVRQEHELSTSGLYAVTRHPVYTGQRQR